MRHTKHASRSASTSYAAAKRASYTIVHPASQGGSAENSITDRPGTSNSTAPIISYCGGFGHRTLIGHAISLTKKAFPDKLLQLISPNWVRVLCGPHIMQAIPLQRPLGWPSVLWSDFPAAEDAIASNQLGVRMNGNDWPCGESRPIGCECSAAGFGGRMRTPKPRSGFACPSPKACGVV